MKIGGLGVPQQPDPKARKPERADQSEKANDNKKPVSDLIELSKSGKPAAESGYAKEIQRGGQSESNANRDLSEVKNRTTNGYYDQPETKEKTSDKLINSEELKDVVDEYHLSRYSQEILAQTPVIRHDRVAEVKEKMTRGFYDNDENYGLFADRIIEHFGI